MDVKMLTTKYGNDSTRLMDMLIEIQDEQGFISKPDVETLSAQLSVSKADIEQTLSFYHFFRTRPSGKYRVYLNNSAVAEMMGREEVARAFEKAAGCGFGEVSSDGKIGLFETADIGMNDQEPAALINNQVFTSLTPGRVKGLVAGMRAGKPLETMVRPLGDGMNESPLVASMVRNNIRLAGAAVFAEFTPGSALKKALSMTPDEVIGEIKKSNLRGRGGAGFPMGMKWEFCRKVTGKAHYVICNADEGEPGTFKDRVILTERPQLTFEGMIIAGYAVGAETGILYLRGEYRYLKKYLESVLDQYRSDGMLGTNILGKNGFNFDIRIQFGAGAYVCGEESGLIESAEGRRGEPRNRPPFPVEKGYLDQPTVVNNVETYCNGARIILNGSAWLRTMGTDQSAGTKVLSISGDCARPGVYEVVWGITIKELLDLVGASDVQAVQVGGASGTCVAPKDFGRKICYGDIATGGAVIVIGTKRNLLHIVRNFVDFFADESCGVCIPCRAGNQILQKKLRKILSGHGVEGDLDEIIKVGEVMKISSRCGLGQTAANPLVTTILNFRELYTKLMTKGKDFDTEFNMAHAVAESCAYAGRTPSLEGEEGETARSTKVAKKVKRAPAKPKKEKKKKAVIKPVKAKAKGTRKSKKSKPTKAKKPRKPAAKQKKVKARKAGPAAKRKALPKKKK